MMGNNELWKEKKKNGGGKLEEKNERGGGSRDEILKNIKEELKI